MGIFDKALDRLASRVTKAAPQGATPVEPWQLQPNSGYGTSAALPRDPNMANVPFTPGVPLIPGAINPVRPDGRPDPRRWEFQVAQNINITPTRLVPFTTLRAAADQIDIVRRCIEVIKAKLSGLEWDITLGQDAIEQVIAEQGVSQVRASAIAKEKFNEDINRLRTFWETPDIANGLTFTDWLNMALEEILVIDALAIWPQRTVGGDLRGLQILDGGTIKPLIDARGMRPEPPHPAYQQILFGFPRSEFSAPTETLEADGEFSSDELAYFTRNKRTTTVYGYSPVERSLPLADLYLRRQQWLRAEYTDGVLPELMFKTDANFGNNPDLLRAYENIFNDDLAGQTEQRKRARLLPNGLEPVQFEGYGERFKDTLDEYIITSICGHFGISPMEIGYSPKSGLGGAGFSDGQQAASYEIGTTPLMTWVARQLSQLSYVFLGMPRELEFKFQPSVTQDAEAHARATDINLKNGTLTINEARSELGLPLLESEVADQPIFVSGAGAYRITEQGAEDLAGGGDYLPVDAAIANEPQAEADQPKPPKTDGPEPDEMDTDEGIDLAAGADRKEIRRFMKWLKKSPSKPFTFDYVPDSYGETLNKFVAVKDYDGARWYAERYLG